MTESFLISDSEISIQEYSILLDLTRIDAVMEY